MAHKLVSGSIYFVDLRNFTLLCSRMADNPQEDLVTTDGQSQYPARLNFLLKDHRAVEDALGLRFAWRHCFSGVKEIGLYFKVLDR